MSKAEYNHQYRLKKKVGAKLKSDPAKIVLRQDAGPTIIQHEAVTVYDSVNKKVRDVIGFFHTLIACTKGGLKLLKKQYHELPFILGGEFNIHFDTNEGLRCVQFLKKELNLDFVSGNTHGND
ncbi:hypothetical protein PV325_012136 [Microctonus aethiopoides]|nr:hypothetical protein PV325_012136 [Microctonus aethiopoides]